MASYTRGQTRLPLWPYDLCFHEKISSESYEGQYGLTISRTRYMRMDKHPCAHSGIQV